MISSKDNITTLILRISCIFSIIGSIIVMIACRFPETMRKKKGRQLIFWLSFSDFGTSIVYFLSSFENSDYNTKQCKTLALLGIFFPVASFFWTDFIAWHIYITISERKIKSDIEWEKIMKLFHIIAWGCSIIIISIIAIFDHAGRGEDNTGGWCWVESSEKTLIYWELIGGKFVEWTSCFIWLPFMYILTVRTLYLLEQSGNITLSSLRNRNPTSLDSSPRSSTTTNVFDNRKFQIFYLKMALVPIIFFLIRLWGTLRIFLYLFSSKHSLADHIADSYLFYLQAIFDPSQGFFNAVIFVFFSAKDRTNFKVFLTTSYFIHKFVHNFKSIWCFSSSNSETIEHTSRDSIPIPITTNPLYPRYAVQDDTIVEISSYMQSGESELTSTAYRESDESTRGQTITRITRASFATTNQYDEC